MNASIIKDEAYNLFPDTFMCHSIVSKLILDKKHIIDIGGIGRLSKFLPDSTKIIDINLKSNKDGCNLQFNDDFFDVAVSINVLEHININKRFLFISEAIRVSKYYTVLCFPFQNAFRCEELKKSMGHNHPIANDKLPDLNTIEYWLIKNKYNYETYYGMPIPLHLALISGMKVSSIEIYKYINSILENNTNFWLCDPSIAQTVFLVVDKNDNN